MKKEFISNIALLLFINLLIRPIYLFGIDMQIQNQLGAEEYGLYFWALGFAYLFSFINDPGIQAFSSKTISGNRSDAQELFAQILGSRLILGGAFIIIALLAARVAGYSGRYLALVGSVSFGMVLMSLFVLLRNTLSSIGHFSKDSLLSALDKVLMILVLGVLLYTNWVATTLTIESVIWIQNGCYLLSGIVVLVILHKQIVGIKLSFNYIQFKALIKAALPFAMLILLTNICNRTDVVMLESIRVDGAFQVGVYAAGYRFLDAANMLGFLFGGLLLPLYSYQFSKQEDVTPLFNTSFKLLFVISSGICLVAVVFHKEITQLAYTAEYADQSAVLGAVMLSVMPIALSHTLGSMIQASGKHKELNLLFVAAIIFNIISNYFIIPSMGALGAAYTTFVTEVLLIIGCLLIVKYRIGISFDYELGLKLIAFFLLSLGIIICLKKFLEVHWMSQIVIFSGIFLLLLFFMRLINVKEVMSFRFFKNNKD